MISTLEIDGQEIQPESINEFDQDYDEIRPQRFERLADNSGVLRGTAAGKLRTTITGRGWAPPGLAMLDTLAPHVLRCAMPNSVSGATTSITLPTSRRSDTDHEPTGFGIVDGREVATPITGIVANVATLTAVPGASGYVVKYFPEITAAILRNTAKLTSRSASFEWVIEAEEV